MCSSLEAKTAMPSKLRENAYMEVIPSLGVNEMAQERFARHQVYECKTNTNLSLHPVMFCLHMKKACGQLVPFS